MTTKPPQPPPPIEEQPDPPPPPPFRRGEHEGYDDYCRRVGLANMIANTPDGSPHHHPSVPALPLPGESPDQYSQRTEATRLAKQLMAIEQRLDRLESTISALLELQ